jgi:hypothetical protein
MNKILETAKTLLEDEFHRSIEFGESQVLDSQFTVLRVPLFAKGLPASIIIKQIPPDARFGASNRLLSEWAALEFLNRLEGDFAPLLLLGNLESLMLITEDLGAVPNLHEILSEGQAETAEAQLIAYGTFLGRLQSASFGREAEFLAIQNRLQAETPPNDSSLDLRLMEDAIQNSLSLANWQNPAELSAEIWHISEAMHDKSPLRVFTHHDAGPHNILLSQNGFRFVDMEFSRYEHALLDMSAVRLAFPPFSHGRPIPQKSLLAYEKAYREAASQAMPSLLDENTYAKALEMACAKWLLTKVMASGEAFFTYIVQNQLTEKMNVERVAYQRRMVYTWLQSYLESFSSTPFMPASYRFLASIAEAMRHHNPDLEAFEFYKAFL